MGTQRLRSAFLYFLLCFVSAAFANASQHDAHLASRVPRFPLVQWEPGTDAALVDWTDVDHALTEALHAQGVPDVGPWQNRLIVDGERDIDIPAGHTSWRLPLERGEQHDIAVEFHSTTTGRLVHRTEAGLLEVTTAQTIRRQSFDDLPLLSVHLPTAVAAAAGVNNDLARMAVDISREKVAWILRRKAPPSLRAVPPHLLDVTVAFGAGGHPLAVQAFDHLHGVALHPALDDFFIKMDAAFNGNSFFWDDMFISLEASWHQPALAAETIDFWYAIQRENGSGVIPREVRKVNRISYNPPQMVQLGGTRENGAYTNPNLSGWVEWQLYALRGPQGSARLPIALQSIHSYLDWLEANRRVAKEPYGLWQDNLGSGMDNLPRGGGQAEPDANARSIWIDLVSQQRAMYLESARMQAALGHWTESAAAAAEAGELALRINQYHWSEDGGFYFDRVPDGKGGLRLDTATSTIAGFWPLWAGAAPPERVAQVADRQLVEGRFGGEFPLPALSESHPLYSDQGNYWLGGRWPNTAAMAIQSFENGGRPDIALDLTRRFLHGVTEVSDEYAQAHPRGTVYEFYGQQRLPDGKVHARPGLEPGHLTREDFAGWGAVPPVYNLIRQWVGMRPVAGFAGAAAERWQWLRTVTSSPIFANTNFLRFNPFQSLSEQRQRAAEGYLEWNVVVDTASDVLALHNIMFHDRAIADLSLRALSPDHFRISVRSEARFPLQVNRLYDGGRVSAIPFSASPIREIGGGAREESIDFDLKPLTAARAS